MKMGLPADRQQYIHRLGRTGRKGKEGEGILLLAPWEEFFLSTIKDLPITSGSVPSVDPETRKKVHGTLKEILQLFLIMTSYFIQMERLYIYIYILELYM